MSFGRNPHVARAQAAQARADEATDDRSRERAHREAAHEWERAAAREKPGKQRELYEANAATARAIADGDPED